MEIAKIIFGLLTLLGLFAILIYCVKIAADTEKEKQKREKLLSEYLQLQINSHKQKEETKWNQ